VVGSRDKNVRAERRVQFLLLQHFARFSLFGSVGSELIGRNDEFVAIVAQFV
jgi:hypothetical protein